MSQLKIVTRGTHTLQGIEFTGEDSVDLMDAVWGIEFMDKTDLIELEDEAPVFVIHRVGGGYVEVRKGEYVMRTLGKNKLFKETKFGLYTNYKELKENVA